MKNHSVCPVEKAKGLDNFFRKLIHNPDRMLKHYIKEGMTVLDFGCGPGLFAIDMSKMVGNKGKIIAVDLQKGMLDKLNKKIEQKNIKNIQPRKCENHSIGISEKIDFILAFYVIHEVPDINKLFKEFYHILKPCSKILIIEPTPHVSKNVRIFHPISNWWQALLAFDFDCWKILSTLKNAKHFWCTRNSLCEFLSMLKNHLSFVDNRCFASCHPSV